MKTAALLMMAAVAGLGLQPAKAQTRPGVDQSRARPIERPKSPARPPAVTGPAVAPTTPAFTPFVVKGVRVDGSSAPVELIAGATRPFVGTTLDSAALGRLTRAVAKAYEQTDIALYNIVAPKQDFADGVVRLVAIEGHVEDAQVNAEPPGQDMSLVDAYVARLTAERPLRRRTLERYTSLIRDIPGAKVQMDLMRTERPGATRLKVDLKQKRFDGGFSVNTRGSAQLGRTQIAFDGYWNGMLTQGDQAHVALAAPTDFRRFRYYALSYARPLNADGLRGAVSAAYLRTRPKGAALSGSATMAGAQVSYPVIRGYKQDLYLSAGLDMLDSRNALFGQTISDERTRALRGAVGWSRRGERTTTGLQGVLATGLEGLGARASDPRLVDPDFVKATLAASHDRLLTSSLALRLRAAAQATDSLLPASEMFSLGGDDYGRAFEASTLVGDYGYGASGELAWTPKDWPKPVAGSEIYGFVDGGRVWGAGRLGRPTVDSALASAGGGVRLSLFSKVVLGVEGARAIDSPTENEDDWRFVFSLRTIID